MIDTKYYVKQQLINGRLRSFHFEPININFNRFLQQNPKANEILNEFGKMWQHCKFATKNIKKKLEMKIKHQQHFCVNSSVSNKIKIKFAH